MLTGIVLGVERPAPPRADRAGGSAGARRAPDAAGARPRPRGRATAGVGRPTAVDGPAARTPAPRGTGGRPVSPVAPRCSSWCWRCSRCARVAGCGQYLEPAPPASASLRARRRSQAARRRAAGAGAAVGRPAVRRGAGPRAAALRAAGRDGVRRLRRPAPRRRCRRRPGPGRSRVVPTALWQLAAGTVGDAGARSPPGPAAAAVTPAGRPADLAAVARPAGPRARAASRRRAPLPVRPPGRRATAPRLHDGTPFPTALYLTCPRATAADRHPRGVRADGRDDRAARPRTPSWRRRYRRAHEAYLAARERARRGARDRGRLRRRHARPGQVPARAGRARARRRAAGSTRWATRRWRCCGDWWRRALRGVDGVDRA